MSELALHSHDPRPLSILIGALGGEGGGVLTDWLVATATALGYPVQSTSIPGVAQRTGATTYYIEIFPVRRSELAGRTPLLGLYPIPGGVDLAVMTELVEAGRALENGFVTPERTLLIASTHRIYSIAEKSALGDGRIDSTPIESAIRALAREHLLADLHALARAQDSVLNAVLLGTIAGCGLLPFADDDYESAIREKGVAVDSNLRGFQAGRKWVGAHAHPESKPPTAERGRPAAHELSEKHRAKASALPDRLKSQVAEIEPEDLRAIVAESVWRLLDYQGQRYAELYLERLGTFERLAAAGLPGVQLQKEVARLLALWMSYEDAIRVADLKTRRDRMAGVRAAAGAQPGQPARIRDFLDPGLDEISAILPPLLARPLLALARRWPRLGKWRRPTTIRTDTLFGFLSLWIVARLRIFRPYTWRYAEEQQAMERWMEALRASAAVDIGWAAQIARMAKLNRGYGETHLRGRTRFAAIFDGVVAPALANAAPSLPELKPLEELLQAALNDANDPEFEKKLRAATGDPARQDGEASA